MVHNECWVKRVDSIYIYFLRQTPVNTISAAATSSCFIVSCSQSSVAENSSFTHQPAMTCGFSFPNHKIQWTNKWLVAVRNARHTKEGSAASAKYWPATGNWLLFVFSNSSSLTNVVYFDVWPDCVFRRRLTGVVICLGNWERGRKRKKERGREGDKHTIKVTRQSRKCISGCSRTVGVQQKAGRKSWPETPDVHLMIKSICERRGEIIFTFSVRLDTALRRVCAAKLSADEWCVGSPLCICIRPLLFSHKLIMCVCVSLWFRNEKILRGNLHRSLKQLICRCKSPHGMNIYISFLSPSPVQAEVGGGSAEGMKTAAAEINSFFCDSEPLKRPCRARGWGLLTDETHRCAPSNSWKYIKMYVWRRNCTTAAPQTHTRRPEEAW